METQIETTVTEPVENDAKNLATIQVIESLSPIEGADKIEVARMKELGWACVVKKGDFQPGDKCVYIGLDSIVPTQPWSEFLRGHNRIKTVKLRGQISQGLVMPLSILPSAAPDVIESLTQVGADVTDFLAVKKYEKQISATMGGKIKGNFPSYVPKTDEERLQNRTRVLGEIKGVPVFITVKMDGSSATYIVKDGEFKVCSRRLEKERPVGDEKDVFWEMAFKYDLENKMKAMYQKRLDGGKKPNIAIQGEVVGPKIQDNKLKLNAPDLFIFNVYCIDCMDYLKKKESDEIITELGLQSVPLVAENLIVPETADLDYFLELAKGNYEGTDGPREGIVVRPMEEMLSAAMKGRLSFKVLNNDFLLKYGE